MLCTDGVALKVKREAPGRLPMAGAKLKFTPASPASEVVDPHQPWGVENEAAALPSPPPKWQHQGLVRGCCPRRPSGL